MSKSIVGDKAFVFAARAIEIYRASFSAPKEIVLGKQFVKCSTSIGANIEEANGAYSRNDFNSKISIAYKEAREAQYWLRLFNESKLISSDEYSILMCQVTEICRMLYSILRTSHFGK